MTTVSKTKFSGKVLFSQEDYYEGQFIYGTEFKEENGSIFILNDLPNFTSSNEIKTGPFNWVEIDPKSLKNLGYIILPNQADEEKQKEKEAEKKQKSKSTKNIFRKRTILTSGSVDFLDLQEAELRRYSLEKINEMTSEEKSAAFRPICVSFIIQHPEAEWKELIQELIDKGRPEEAHILGVLLRSQNIAIDNEVSEVERKWAKELGH